MNRSIYHVNVDCLNRLRTIPYGNRRETLGHSRGLYTKATKLYYINVPIAYAYRRLYILSVLLSRNIFYILYLFLHIRSYLLR